MAGGIPAGFHDSAVNGSPTSWTLGAIVSTDSDVGFLDVIVRLVVILSLLPLFCPGRLVAQEDPCAQWEQKFVRLPPARVQELNRFGIIRHLGIVIGPKVFADCRSRLMLQGFIEDHLAGKELNRPERAWALSNRAELEARIRALWPYLSSVDSHLSDGAFTSEAYSILRDPLVTENGVLEVVTDDIAAHGIGPGLLYLLWVRPFEKAAIVRVLEARLRMIEGDHVLPEALVVYILLDRYGESVETRLDELLDNIEPESAMFERCQGLVLRIRARNADIAFDDVADLYYTQAGNK